MMKKLGLDYHGVINTRADFFKPIAKALTEAGHEVHIITGAKETPELREAIDSKHGMYKKYTHFFSIVDFHEAQGTDVWYDDKGTPWMDEDTWDKTKGEYCKRVKIDLHIDDSVRYLEHFTTPFKLFLDNEEGLEKLKQEISELFGVEI